MSEYKVIVKSVSTLVWRDVQKAAEELAEDVNAEVTSGWQLQGGIASVQAGASVYLLQALARE
jgi:hypothetical protein